MKSKYLFFVPAVIFFLFFSSPSFSGPFSEHISGEDSWFYSELAKNSDKLLRDALTDIDKKFNQSVSNYVITELLGGSLDDQVLQNLVGVIPQLNFTALVFPSGPSETQIMLQILLEVMEDMKEEIIDAVDANYQDETEANLNTVIYEVGSYNLRPEAERKNSYEVLFQLKILAQYVKERIALRDDNAVENLHLYMLAASVQFEIEREYTRWLTLDTNPNASVEYTQSRIDDQFRYFLDGVYEYVNNDVIGELGVWRSVYNESFSSPSTYQFSRTVPGTPVCTSSPRTGTRCLPVTRYLYKYSMNNIYVEFGAESTRFNPIINMYDAEGNNLSPMWACKVGCRPGSSQFLDRLRRNPAPINAHKDSNPAFAEYLRIGYSPIAEVIDAWWLSYYGTPRPHSEVDSFMAAN